MLAVDATSSNKSTGSSVSVSHTCAANAVLLACVANAIGVSPSSVTYNGVGMTQVITATDGSGRQIQIYKLQSPASGANTLQANYSSAGGNSIFGISFTGADATSFVGASNTGTGTPYVTGTDTASVSVTTTASNSYIVAIIETGATRLGAENGAQTVIGVQQDGANQSSAASYKSVAAAGSASMSYSVVVGNTNGAMGIVEVLAAATTSSNALFLTND